MTDYYELGAGGMAGLSMFNDSSHDESPLDVALIELIKLSASLGNGCAH